MADVTNSEKGVENQAPQVTGSGTSTAALAAKPITAGRNSRTGSVAQPKIAGVRGFSCKKTLLRV
ncbi:TPA: hypothetical protein ACH3X1_014784 [Trebouxia sp. C0004]